MNSCICKEKSLQRFPQVNPGRCMIYLQVEWPATCTQNNQLQQVQETYSENSPREKGGCSREGGPRGGRQPGAGRPRLSAAAAVLQSLQTVSNQRSPCPPRHLNGPQQFYNLIVCPSGYSLTALILSSSK